MRIFYCPPPDGESLLLSLLLLVFNPGNWLSAGCFHQNHFLTRHTAWPLLAAGICRLTQECRRRSSRRRRRRRSRRRRRGTGPKQAGTGEIAVSAGKEPLKQISECWNWRRPAINNTRYVLKMSTNGGKYSLHLGQQSTSCAFWSQFCCTLVNKFCAVSAFLTNPTRDQKWHRSVSWRGGAPGIINTEGCSLHTQCLQLRLSVRGQIEGNFWLNERLNFYGMGTSSCGMCNAVQTGWDNCNINWVHQLQS